MKIIFCFDKRLVESDINSLSTYPLSKYSKLEILHGLGVSNIILIFNYWEQKIICIEGGLLAFIYNIKSGINWLKSGEKKIAHAGSIEQGYSLKLRLENTNIIISAFNNEFSIELPKFEIALNDMAIKAFDDLPKLYPGLEDNIYYKECKEGFGIK